MYEGFFQLKSSPFSMTPDPGAMFWTSSHREALAGLTYAISCKKGFVVLTGPAGTGKTTLLRKLLESSPVPLEASFVYNPTLTTVEFVDLVLAEFKICPPESGLNKAQKLFRFEEFLLRTQEAGKTAVLVVDEAHKLAPEVLEEIRLFTNFETSSHKLLQIVLAGQTELDDVLERDDLQQLKQRVAAHLRTSSLSMEDVQGYMELRWGKAGGSLPLPFNADAIRQIHEWSRGIPRVINGICDNALISSFGAGRRQIGAQEILDVAKDLGLRPPVAKAESATPQPAVEAESAPPPPTPEPVLPSPPVSEYRYSSIDYSKGFLRIPFREELSEPEVRVSTLERVARSLGLRTRRRNEVAG